MSGSEMRQRSSDLQRRHDRRAIDLLRGAALEADEIKIAELLVAAPDDVRRIVEELLAAGADA